jgi:hypothetical protein
MSGANASAAFPPELLQPWANYHGDLPDFDHPLRPVYESGIQYAVELLATVLKVTNYEVCDGTEEFDGDLGGTLLNIVLAAMPKDEHGDPIDPREMPETFGKVGEVSALIAALPEGVVVDAIAGAVTFPAGGGAGLLIDVDRARFLELIEGGE